MAARPEPRNQFFNLWVPLGLNPEYNFKTLGSNLQVLYIDLWVWTQITIFQALGSNLQLLYIDLWVWTQNPIFQPLGSKPLLLNSDLWVWTQNIKNEP